MSMGIHNVNSDGTGRLRGTNPAKSHRLTAERGGRGSSRLAKSITPSPSPNPNARRDAWHELPRAGRARRLYRRYAVSNKDC